MKDIKHNLVIFQCKKDAKKCVDMKVKNEVKNYCNERQFLNLF